jgi:uncharacterized protein (DUF433 family)
MSQPLIVSDPAVMMGKPVVAGTRITVELILEKLGAGETIEQLLDAHPHLTKPAILAALEFDAGVWDRQLEEDVAGGQLDPLAEEAFQDLRERRCTGL